MSYPQDRYGVKRSCLYILSAFLAICVASLIHIVEILQPFLALWFFWIFGNFAEDILEKLNV